MASRARPASGVSRTAWDDYGGARPDSQFDFGQDGIRDDPDLGPSGNESVYNGSGAKPKSSNTVAKKGSSKPTSFIGKIGKGIRSLWATRQTEDVKGDRELHVKTTLRELIVYIVFLVILCIITFGMTSTTMYYYTKVMSDLFLDTTSTSGGSFRTITSVEDFWKFAKGPLMKGLYWETWYNNVSVPEDQLGYIYYENKLLGVPRMRQLQVHSNSCVVHDDFKDVIRECYESYSESLENKEPFGLKDSETAWYYRSNDELDGSSHWGLIATYSGAGYVQDLDRNLSQSAAKIEYLFNNRWIQRGTRIVFIDFTVYNANINLFCVVRLTVEFPPTGGAIPHATMRTVKLIRYVTVMDYFIMACEFIFCLFLTYYMIEEAIEIKKHKFAYFKNFWNILDIVVIVIALVCVAFNIYRLIKVNDLLSNLLNKPDEYADFVFLGYGQTQFDNAIAIAVFFAWIKIFKYISFNKTMTQLSSTLGKCAKDLAGFAVMFFIIFLAFTQLGYLLFGTQVKDFSNFQNSFFTLFRIILGDFDFDQLEAANRVLGPIFFMLFVFFVFFVLINMFLAIINDTYSEVKGDMANQKNEFEMADYFKRGYDKMISKLNFKHDKIVDIQKALHNADLNNDKQVDFNEWRQDLKTRGYADGEIEALFAKYDTDGDRVLDEAEQKRMQADLNDQKLALNKEYDELEKMGTRPESAHRSTSRVSINDGSGSDSDDEDSRTKSSRSGPSQSVAYEEFTVLSRRVDRMEHSIGSIVSKIDAVLVKLELMEKAKLKRRETMGKILDSITESDGTSDEVKREQMERLVREELERWDSESSITPQPSGRGVSPGSGGRAGARSRSRPDSGGNSPIQVQKGEAVLPQFDDKSDDESIESLDICLRVESCNVSKPQLSGVCTAHTSVSEHEKPSTSTQSIRDHSHVEKNMFEQVNSETKDGPFNSAIKDNFSSATRENKTKSEIKNDTSVTVANSAEGNSHYSVSLMPSVSNENLENPKSVDESVPSVPAEFDPPCPGQHETVQSMSEDKYVSDQALKQTESDKINKPCDSVTSSHIDSQTKFEPSNVIESQYDDSVSPPQVHIDKQLKYYISSETKQRHNRLLSPPGIAQKQLNPKFQSVQQVTVSGSQCESTAYTLLSDQWNDIMSLRDSDQMSPDQLDNVKHSPIRPEDIMNRPSTWRADSIENAPSNCVEFQPGLRKIEPSLQESDVNRDTHTDLGIDVNLKSLSVDNETSKEPSKRSKQKVTKESKSEHLHLNYDRNTSVIPPISPGSNSLNGLNPKEKESSNGLRSTTNQSESRKHFSKRANHKSSKHDVRKVEDSTMNPSEEMAKETLQPKDDSDNGLSLHKELNDTERHPMSSSKSKQERLKEIGDERSKLQESLPNSETMKSTVEAVNFGKHKLLSTKPKTEHSIGESYPAKSENKKHKVNHDNLQQKSVSTLSGAKTSLKDFSMDSTISSNLTKDKEFSNDKYDDPIEDQSKTQERELNDIRKKKRKERSKEKHGTKHKTRASKSAVVTERGQKVSIGTLAKKLSSPDIAKFESLNDKDESLSKSIKTKSRDNALYCKPGNQTFLPQLANPSSGMETPSKQGEQVTNSSNVAMFRYSKHIVNSNTNTAKIPYSVVPGSMSLGSDTDVSYKPPDGDRPVLGRNQVTTHTSCKTPVMEKISTAVFV